MKHKGTIETWKDNRGFGFIAPDGGGKSVFVHIKSYDGDGSRPRAGQVVSYELSKDRQGRPCAVNVTPAGARKFQLNKTRLGFAALLLAAVVIVGVLIATGSARLSTFLVAWYVLMSIVTFVIYALDKWAARTRRWRTPEATLHLLAIMGGWPGAYVAQELLRHKSSKQPFQTIFWISVVVNMAILGWLLTPGGESTLVGILQDL
ncbi:MAG: DNA-binding protein [marine bacterium B5-7]|nr:MAG: DNA-binding protein [marine bacterium B5-7]